MSPYAALTPAPAGSYAMKQPTSSTVACASCSAVACASCSAVACEEHPVMRTCKTCGPQRRPSAWLVPLFIYCGHLTLQCACSTSVLSLKKLAEQNS